MQVCSTCQAVVADGIARCPADGGALTPSVPGEPLLDGVYRLERRLGAGGMGEVFEAWHRGLERRVALKVLRPERALDPGSLARFRTEAVALGRLDHPGVVRATDAGVDARAGGLPYLVMDRLEGEPLRAVLERDGAVEPRRALALVTAIAAALDAAHAAGVVHGDLKPDNVIVGPDGAVRLIDLGLARRVEWAVPAPDGAAAADDGSPAGPTTTTRGGRWVGTAGYMAPELFAGEAPGCASDVYALAVLAFELVTGRRPFVGPVSRVASDSVLRPPPPPSALDPRLPTELDGPILAALAKQPGDRPATAGALARGFADALLAADRRAWRRHERRRRPGLVAVIAAGAALAAGAVAISGAGRWLDDEVALRLMAAAPPHAPDPRLLLLTIDDDALATDPTPLPERGAELGQRVSRLLAAGVRVVAVDAVLPADWATEPDFGRAAVAGADRIVLAAMQQPDGAVVGDECVRGPIAAALGAVRSAALFGLVNVDTGPDRRVLRQRLELRRQDGDVMPAFAWQVVRRAGGSRPTTEAPVWLDYRVDIARVERLSWHRLDAALGAGPARFADRIVLIGLEYTGAGDRYPGAGHSRRLSGLELQALLVDTLLAGRRLRPVTGWLALIAAAVVGTLVALALLLPARARAAAGWLVATLVLTPLAAWLGFRAGGWLPPAAALAAGAVVAVTAAVATRRRSLPYPV